MFNDDLYIQSNLYKRVFEKYSISVVKDKVRKENPMSTYATKMATIIENEINSKLDDLDFDKDPYQIVGILIEKV